MLSLPGGRWQCIPKSSVVSSKSLEHPQNPWRHPQNSWRIPKSLGGIPESSGAFKNALEASPKPLEHPQNPWKYPQILWSIPKSAGLIPESPGSPGSGAGSSGRGSLLQGVVFPPWLSCPELKFEVIL